MQFGEALAQLRMPQHVSPELEEDRQPAVVVPVFEGRDQVFHPLICGCSKRKSRLGLRHAEVDTPLVDREEEVFLRREVRVDGALRVAGVVRHRFDRGGVEAVLGEQSVGRLHELRAGPCLAVSASEGGTHTVSI